MEKILLLFIIMNIFIGCSSTDRVGGENLSSVMEKSGSSNSSDRNVNTGSKVYSEKSYDKDEEENSLLGEIISEILFGWIPDGTKEKESKVEIKKSYSEPITKEKENKVQPQKGPIVVENPEWIVAGENEISFYTGKDISYINRSGIAFKAGVPDGGPEFGIIFFVGNYELKDEFKYKNNIKSDGLVGIELNGKGCIKKLKKDLGLNAGFGLGMESIYWKYKNPLYSDTKIIREDNLGAGRLFGSIGIDYRKDDSVYFNFEIEPEFFLTEDNTKQGFINDVFEKHCGVGVKIEAGYSF